MTRTILKLLLVSMLVTCNLQDATAGYSRIDSYLKSAVDSDDINLNLEAAELWLEKNSDLRTTLLKKNPTGDFQTFAALKQVLGADRCDEESYKIMDENEQNIGDLFIKIHSDKVDRRVDVVVFKIFEQHARNCAEVWPAILKQRLHLVEDQKKLMRAGLLAEAILMETIGSSIVTGVKQLYDRFIGNELEIKDLKRGRSIQQKLNEYAQDDSDRKYLHPVQSEKKLAGKKVIRRDKIEELIDRHLIEPCSYFVDQLGASIFIPARWDAMTLPPKPDDTRFYQFWADFRICEVLLKNGRALTNDIVKIIERELE